MKKQKKGKTVSGSSRRVSREASPGAGSLVFPLSSGSSSRQRPVSDVSDRSRPRAVVSGGREEPRSGIHVRRGLRAAALSSERPRHALAAKCQQIYATALVTDASGRTRLDDEYLAQALADIEIGTLAEQALYSLALSAALDGQETLGEGDVLAALQLTAQAS